MEKHRGIVDTPAVRKVTLVVLAVAVALAAAAAALAGPKDPQLHKRAADVRLAKRLIISLHDLPAGFVDKAQKCAMAHSNRKCDHNARPILWAHIASGRFQGSVCRNVRRVDFEMVDVERTQIRHKQTP